MSNAMTRHSDAELLAAFVDGNLDREQLEAVTAHLGECEECRGVIGEAALFEQEEENERKPRTAWLAIAAAVVVAVISYPLVTQYVRQRNHEREITEQVNALHSAQARAGRALEGRFAGQNPWGRYINNRGGSESTEDEVETAALQLWATTEHDTSPVARRAHAQGEAVDKNLNNHLQMALDTLQRIPNKDAKTWNDIAVVALAAQQLDEASKAVEQALAKQPDMPEALFNRALILEARRSGVESTEKAKVEATAAARKAWERYLQVDSKSQWAEDAQRKLSLLNQ